ncbi:MAG: MBL fold metallo-hydrolase [Lachnospiraceae bacterium]|nr:MBL fold metallo-hydrolase [Lachnospiraceae bacterium]
MRINEHVHLIRKEFWVTSKVKRYINIYLITGKNCYLIDSGVAGSETEIAEYMESIGRCLNDIKGIFLTH